MLQEHQRQRAMRIDVRIAQQALKVVLPMNRQIGPWQVKAARLLAVAEKLRSSGSHNPGVAAETEALLDMVERQHRSLIHETESLPPDVAGSSRLQDTARALQSVAGVLNRALTVMKSKRDFSV